MTKITLKKGKNITKTNIKKLLKDENTKIICNASFTDDYWNDAEENFHREEEVSCEWFEKIGLSCMTHIFQPRFSKTGYDKKSFQVKLGCSDMYTITNENIEWV